MNEQKKNDQLLEAWAWQMGDSIFFDLEKEDTLLDALGYLKPEKMPRIVSFVGGGGKSTSMEQLARELAERGFRVLVTTTTHIAWPKDMPVWKADHASDILNAQWEGNLLTAGKVTDSERTKEGVPLVKLTMPEGLEDPEILGKLLEQADFILIEADGAKRCPIKVPASYEPVILPQTGLVIACAGLSAVGKPLKDVCFRFDTCGSWLMRGGEDRTEPEDMALILMDGRGSRKDLEGRYYKIILNQADEEQDLDHARQLICALPGPLQPGVVVTHYKK